MHEDSTKPIRPIVRLQRKNIPDEELLGDLRRVACAMGQATVSPADYKIAGRFSSRTIEKRFGSWSVGLATAGLKPGFEKVDSVAVLFENLLDVWTKLGRQPRYDEFRRPLSRWSTYPYETRFGSWNEALTAFGRFVDPDCYEEPVSASPVERRRDSTRQTSRDPNLRLRWKVLSRDFFKCKCGRSPATDARVILHVDHEIAWSKGGETVLENLRTLCDRCNLGKGAS